jgi:hypothetical protein
MPNDNGAARLRRLLWNGVSIFEFSVDIAVQLHYRPNNRVSHTLIEGVRPSKLASLAASLARAALHDNGVPGQIGLKSVASPGIRRITWDPSKEALCLNS